LIKKISSIKAAGTFDNYRWDNSLPPFEDKVLIYGWNGCGKSTLAHAISALTNEKLQQIYQTAIKDEQGNNFDTINNTIPNKIFIFNADFIKTNSEYDYMQEILYLAEENIELKKDLVTVEQTLSTTLDEEARLRKEVSESQQEIDKIYVNCAKNVKDTLLPLVPITKYLNYNKTDFKQDVEGATTFPDDGANTINTLKNSCAEKPKETTIPLLEVIDVKKIMTIAEEAKKYLETNIISYATEKYSPDILNWLEKGMTLEENCICKYCGNTVSKNRKKEIEELFNKEYQEFQKKLDITIEKLSKIEIASLTVSGRDFYEENYDVKDRIINYVPAKNKIDTELKNLKDLLDTKKGKTNTSLTFSTILLEQGLTEINDMIVHLNEIINLTNVRTTQFKKRHDEDINALHKLLVSQHITKNCINEKNEKLVTKEKQLKEKTNDKNSLTERIDSINSKIIDVIRGADEFNNMLNMYLGRAEFKLEYVPDKKGYKLLRYDNTSVKNISEGERTAIAFIYFITKVFESGNDVSKSIVIFDDPVSSLDSNNLFGAYSLIVSKFDKCHQLFLLTHNYTFYRFFKEKFCKSGRDKILYMVTSEYNNIDGQRKRSSKIIELPKSLKVCNSEHAYLYKELKNYVKPTKDVFILDLGEYYKIANIARKFLENYAGFRFPHVTNLSDKLDCMCNSLDTKSNLYATRLFMKERIIKFTNWYSHQNDEECLSVQESSEVIWSILELIKEIDPEHYRGLEKTLN